MNKYYTPTIEEFFPGFEYEINDSAINENLALRQSVNWYKCKFWNKGVETLDMVDISIECEDIRVKYLDKEDVEALGFDKTNEKYKYQKFVKNIDTNTYSELTLSNENKVVIELYELTGVDSYKEDWSSKIIFEGYIKNKSELKKLLKQLGI